MQRLLPPALVLLLFLAMTVLTAAQPGASLLDWPWRLTGLAPLAGGLTLVVAGSNQFARIGTNIKTFNDPDRLVETGPFAHTRNPMYLGLFLTLVGVALLMGSATAWIGPLAFGVAADRWYIPFEEGRMATVFGEAYDAYRNRVPRWVRLSS